MPAPALITDAAARTIFEKAALPLLQAKLGNDYIFVAEPVANSGYLIYNLHIAPKANPLAKLRLRIECKTVKQDRWAYTTTCCVPMAFTVKTGDWGGHPKQLDLSKTDWLAKLLVTITEGIEPLVAKVARKSEVELAVAQIKVLMEAKGCAVGNPFKMERGSTPVYTIQTDGENIHGLRCLVIARHEDKFIDAEYRWNANQTVTCSSVTVRQASGLSDFDLDTLVVNLIAGRGF